MKYSQCGFTLVELSIVLVILGLLVGGVLTGQSLIRAAELRSITTQEQRYVAAVQTFRDKYFALPGDMSNATSYWGIAGGSTGNDSSCISVASTTSATCNGNGDGQLVTSTGSYETFRFWQHLANAGLIEGSYTGGTGTYAGCGANGVFGTNAPTARISGSGWLASYLAPGFTGTSTSGNGQSAQYAGNYNNYLVFTAPSPCIGMGVPILKVEDTYNIDTKLDDGKPGTGKVISNWPTCSTSASQTDYTGTYNLTNTATAVCSVYFLSAF